MDVMGYVTGAAKACSSAVKAIDELVKRARSMEKRQAIVKAIREEQVHTSRANILMASLVYGQEVTYADILYNLVFMVEIRTGMVMSLEDALSKTDLTQKEINDACYDIYHFIVDLRFSIRQLHGLLAQIKDEDIRAIPISLGVVLGETDTYARQLIAELGYDDKTGNNQTDIFSNPTKRKMLEHLCAEMKRMISVLCDMPVSTGPGRRPSVRKESHSGFRRRSDDKGVLLVNKLSLEAFERRIREFGFDLSADKAAQAFDYFKKRIKSFDQNQVSAFELELIADALSKTIPSGK